MYHTKVNLQEKSQIHRKQLNLYQRAEKVKSKSVNAS